MLQLCSELKVLFKVECKLEYFITLMNVLLKCYTYVVTALLEYIDLFSQR